MKCQKCGIHNATTHIKRIVNGEQEEYMLCTECAKKMGYSGMFSDMTNDFSNFLGSFLSNALPARTQATRCDICGSTYHDIQKAGKVGCAHCYQIFYDELLPSIRRIHGNTAHCGKKTNLNRKEQTVSEKKSTIAELKEQLKKAIDTQEFEKAAEIRDKIRKIEGENNE